MAFDKRDEGTGGGQMIESLIQEHERLRAEGINLIASENYLSPGVRKALAGDLGGRYHTEWYGGSRIARDIIESTEELARKLFRARHAFVFPLSGNTCDLAILFSLTDPGDNVAMVSTDIGGYPLGVDKFHRERVALPVDPRSFEFDIPSARAMLENVWLTILGSSFIPFPHPVREMYDIIKNSERPGHLVFDGAHVLGLIACGQFQDPLREGAEILFGSTHKTFYGPQGGMILTDSTEHADTISEYLNVDIETGIGLVDNPHMNRIAALGVALEEMLEDRDYAVRVIGNAKTLARALDELGLPVRFGERGYTESHQVLLDLEPTRGKCFCRELEEVGMFIDVAGRLGTAEVTHRGMGPADMEEVAKLISDVYHNGARTDIATGVRKLASG